MAADGGESQPSEVGRIKLETSPITWTQTRLVMPAVRMLMPSEPVVPRRMESPASVGCRVRGGQLGSADRKAERWRRTNWLMPVELRMKLRL